MRQNIISPIIISEKKINTISRANKTSRLEIINQIELETKKSKKKDGLGKVTMENN